MPEDVFLQLFSNIGAPAALCFYTLFRVNQTLKELTEAINRLTCDMDKRLDRLEEDVRALKTRAA